MVGDALARVLEAAGADVAREFYINDRGTQMDLFGASIEATALGQPVPEDGYHGGYIADLAARVVAENPGILELTGDERTTAFREAGYAVQLKEQQDQLDAFNTHFDVWFSERSLHDSETRRPTASPPSSRSCAPRVTCSTPTVRCGCAPPTSTTTRTGC